MLSSILTTIGLPVLMRLLSDALGQVDNPVLKGASDALSQAELAWRNGQVTLDQRKEANRHIERMADIAQEQHVLSLTEINETMRTELKSEDRYVRRMRPTFGYIMAVTWGAQMIGIAYVIIFDTARAGIVLNAMSALTAIWAVGLSVLGIYVYKRSEDKKLTFPIPSQHASINKPVPPRKPLTETVNWNE